MKHKEVAEEPIFAGVRNPADVRRNLLEASRAIVETLRRYEGIRAVREKKLVLTHKIREEIKEVYKLVYRLRASLPTVIFKPLYVKNEHIPAQKAVKKEKPAVIKAAAIAQPKKPRNELDRLEAELAEIESKLNSIS